MSNWPYQIPGVYTETVGMDETGDPLAWVLSFGTATTYGAWVSAGASFSRPMDGIFVHAHTSDTDAQRFMICIAVGSGADANIIVKDLWFPVSFYHDACVYWLPIKVPAGQTLFAKMLTPNSGSKRIGLVGLSGNFPQPVGFSRCEGIGMDTTNCWPFSFTPAAASTITWNQVVSSTASRYGAMTIRDYYGSDNIGNGLSLLGIGAASAEQRLFRWFSSKNRDYSWGSMDAVPLDIPASSRLSIAAYKDGTLGTRYCNLVGFVH